MPLGCVWMVTETDISPTAAGITLFVSGYAATCKDCPAQLNKYPQIRYFTLTVVAWCYNVLFDLSDTSYQHFFLVLPISPIPAHKQWKWLPALRLTTGTLPHHSAERLVLNFHLLPELMMSCTEFVNIGPILKECYSLIPYLVMAILMFSMTLYKCRKHLFAVRGQQMPAFTLFLRDSIFLFLTILVRSIVELPTWNNGHPTLAQVPIMQVSVAALPNSCLHIGIQTRNDVRLCPLLHAVVGARILLNTKGLATKVDNNTIPTIEFTYISFRQQLAAKAHIP
ncbi:hypothetical protein K438DRAFT_1765309 [Mycena galopus ATCC 62051]|nr:hypothetical protein K438DRAFT_1765309 [Mycena galopus ATCC 62051]